MVALMPSIDWNYGYEHEVSGLRLIFAGWKRYRFERALQELGRELWFKSDAQNERKIWGWVKI